MNRSVNHPSRAEAEALALLAEECGEAIQAVAKALRHGLDSYHPAHPERGDNSEQLERELGDILAAIDILGAVGAVRPINIHRKRVNKLARVQQYLHHVSAAHVSDAAIHIRRAWRTPEELAQLIDGGMERTDG